MPMPVSMTEKINVISSCSVFIDNNQAAIGEQNFANLLISFIGKRVTHVSLNSQDEIVRIIFEEGSFNEMPYHEVSFVGVEAIVFFGCDDEWFVLP